MNRRDQGALLVGLVALAVLVAIVLWSPAAKGLEIHGAAPSRFTEATQNVQRTQPASHVAQAVSAAMARASIVRLQEVESTAARAGLARALRRHPTWATTHRQPAKGGATPILWDRRTWASAGPAHWARIHRGIPGLTPDRYLVWKALRYRPTGQVVTIANVHSVNRYCYANRVLRAQQLAEAYWDRVAAWTQRQARIRPARAILLGGDFNCPLTHTAAPDPGPELRPLYRLDRSRSLDHLITARRPAGQVAGLRRWSRPARSDHRLQLRALALLDPVPSPVVAP